MAYHDQLSKIFRDVEVDLGTSNLSNLVMESLFDSIKGYRGDDINAFYTQFKSLIKDTELTEPRYAIITDCFYELLRYIYQDEACSNSDNDCHIPKDKLLKYLRKLINDRKKTIKKITNESQTIDVNGKTLLLYNKSRTLEEILKNAISNNQKFKAIVVEQDPNKTLGIIEFLDKNKVQYKVVPAYMISHMTEEIDMLFLSALTIKSTMEIVMDTGANGIITQLHVKKKPIYVFMTTNKFSLWKAEPKSEIFQHVHSRKHQAKDITYERVKFSHDRVSLDLLTKIVTEEGVFSPEEIRTIFQDKLEKRLAFEKRIQILGM